jgi:hypothetical protein
MIISLVEISLLQVLLQYQLGVLFNENFGYRF